jgi:hypothetical protein
MGGKIMKILKTIISLIMLFSFICCSINAERQNIYSTEFVRKFGKLDGKQKMQFFNSLDKKTKIRFVAVFMMDRSFDLPPIEVVKFYSDGVFICDKEAEEGGMIGGNLGDKTFKYLLGKWYFKDDKIFIKNLDPNNTVYGKYMILDDVKIDEYYEDKRPSAHFVFHVIKGVDRDGSILDNQQTDLWGGVTDDEAPSGISPAIDSYTKLKQAKKKKVTGK